MGRVVIELFKMGSRGVIGTLELAKDSDIALTKSIADIQDISKRKTTFSKSIELAGTIGNNTLLSHLYNINNETLTFDRNKTQPCRVVCNSIVLVDSAYLQINSVSRASKSSGELTELSYTVNVKSNTADIFTSIKSLELTDLNLSKKDIPDHRVTQLTPTLLKNSFSNTYANGWKAGIKDVNSNSVAVADTVPMLYVWTLWNRLISNAGFRYTFDEIGVINSNLVNSTKDDLSFRKLLIPYLGEALGGGQEKKEFYSAEVKNAGLSIYSQWDSQYGTIKTGLKSLVTLPIETYDPSNSFTSNTYTAQFSGLLKLKVSTAINNLNINNGTGVAVNTFANTVKIRHVVEVYRNGSLASTSYTYNGSTQDLYTINYGTNIANGVTTLATNVNDFVYLNVDVMPGDAVQVKHYVKAFCPQSSLWFGDNTYDPPTPASVRVEFSTAETTVQFVGLVNVGFFYGAILDFNKMLPKMKQDDFFRSIITAFNLFVEVDENDENLLIFKTRDYYYSTGKKHDFTKLLVKEKEQVITWISDTQKKSKLLTYKNNDKGLRGDYFKQNQEIYQQAKYTFDNEHITDIDKVEIGFNPAPFFEKSGFFITELSNKDDVLLLLDGGTRSKNLTVLGWGGTGAVSSGVYPITLHVDNPTFPTFDLSFGTCRSFYASGVGVTSNNLFNKFWRSTFNQLNKGKLLSCVLTIPYHTFAQIRLNDMVYIRDTWYLINSIKDYNPAKGEAVQVELMTSDEMKTAGNYIQQGGVIIGVPPVLAPPPTFGGNNVVFNPFNGDIVRGGQVRIKGVSNNVAGRGNDVTGDGNVIGGDNNNVSGDNQTSVDNNGLIQSNVNVITQLQNEIATLIRSVNVTTLSSMTELKDLIRLHSLILGGWYRVNEFLFKAISDSLILSMCYVSKYVIPNQYYTPFNIGAGPITHYYLGIYGQSYAKGSHPNSTATNKYYVIHGGKMWLRNTSGADVAGSSQGVIASGWTVLNGGHNKVYQGVFNFDTEKLAMIIDDKGNVIKNAYNSTDATDWTDFGNDLIQNNECFGIYNNWQNSTTPATIKNNKINGIIWFNSNNGNIENNINNGGIYYNSNAGDISGNSNGSNIQSNFNKGYIRRNSNNGQIRNNTSGAFTMDIYDNRNNGYIDFNNATANIKIFSNTNNGNVGSTSAVNRGANVNDTIVNK